MDSRHRRARTRGAVGRLKGITNRGLLMKLFVDTADVKELETCLERGFPSGVTTNPMLVARSGCTDFGGHIRSMITALIKHDAKIPLSVEVNTVDPEVMADQAEEF